MDKRILLGIGIAAAAGILIWLATRPGESATADVSSPAAIAVPMTPIPAANALAPDASPEPAESNLVRPPVPVAHAGTLPAAPDFSAPTSEPPMPIDVTPGFEYLNKPASSMEDTDGQYPMWRHHQKLQSEPRDDTWAPRIEAALRAAFKRALAADGSEPKRVELLVIECRTTGCEIQAGGYIGSDGTLGADFTAAYFKVFSGPLAAEFDLDASTTSVEARPEGRAAFLAFLPRKE